MAATTSIQTKCALIHTTRTELCRSNACATWEHFAEEMLKCINSANDIHNAISKKPKEEGLSARDVAPLLGTAIDDLKEIDRESQRVMDVYNGNTQLRTMTDALKEEYPIASYRKNLTTSCAYLSRAIRRLDNPSPMEICVQGLATPQGRNRSASARAHEDTKKLISWNPEKADLPAFVKTLNYCAQDLLGVFYASIGKKFPSGENVGLPCDADGLELPAKDIYRELCTLADDLKKVETAAQAAKAKHGDIDSKTLKIQGLASIEKCLEDLASIHAGLSNTAAQIRQFA